METILPFIIAAIVFGFQIYANFKKEQEKARKRNPSQPQQPRGEVVIEYEEAEPHQKKPLRKIRDKEVLVERKQPEVHQRYERYTGVLNEAKEVRRTKETRPAYGHHSGRLDPYVIDESNLNTYADFDLRDAVIKAAILDRPYKD
ncbi:hypothetical protein H8S90_17180 [Olivibacter sp. SDN3]|uniref:hypothetical protein n=1 Tax=Olivibacter sp. SDN3 TaxID=2764720 RepID=UPI00165102D7|nr:hypothetical protein [Olivibacter sp. SDN3]QNL48509.1 hypothetical protein H8S90_17180 [Olivibacter sp. SDN3]